jgi:hypothetical protein
VKHALDAPVVSSRIVYGEQPEVGAKTVPAGPVMVIVEYPLVSALVALKVTVYVTFVAPWTLELRARRAGPTTDVGGFSVKWSVTFFGSLEVEKVNVCEPVALVLVTPLAYIFTAFPALMLIPFVSVNVAPPLLMTAVKQVVVAPLV